MKEALRLTLETTVTDLYDRVSRTPPSSEESAPLHTDRLEAKYGPVHAQVHEHTTNRRVIDIVDGSGISRTHAVTWFPNVDDREDPLGDVRSEIAGGALIGKTIKAHGFDINKPGIVEGSIPLPGWLQERFNVTDTTAGFNIYQFIASKDGVNALYGIVCEIYSPDFISAEMSGSEMENAKTGNDAIIFREALQEYLSNPRT